MSARTRALLSLGVLTTILIAACSSASKQPGAIEIPTKVSKANRLRSLNCTNAAHYAGQVVGDGHCVSLIKRCSGAPDTRFWHAGSNVMQAAAPLAPGSIIATFRNGKYPNITGWHAAIYISHGPEGIWVWDQWVGKAVHKRLIRYRNDGADPGNTAQEYRQVLID